MKGDENVMNLITKISNLHESAKKIKDISEELLKGEVNRIADNYVKYSGWYK